MSGFEVVGLILGAIPLILRTFEHMVGVLENYRHFDKKLKGAHRKVKIAQGQFCLHIFQLLSPVLDHERLKQMLRNPTCNYWQLVLRSFDTSDEDILSLGLSFESVRYCIEGFKEATEQYQKILFELSTESPLQSLAKNVIGAVGVAIPDSGEPTKLSWSQKLRLSSKSFTRQFDTLYDEMVVYNRALHEAVLCQIAGNTSRTSQSRKPPNPQTPGRQSGLTFQRTSLDLTTIQETRNASESLHGILYNFPNLECRCHALHLRLDFNHQVNSATERRQFSFLMTSTTHEDSCENFNESILHLVFTDNDMRPPTTPPNNPLEAHATLCKERSPLSDPYERFFPASNGSSGFIMRRTVDTTVGSVTPLAHMLSNLITGECYQIAFNLTSSVFLHYSSPWLRDWTLDTIRFVKSHNNPKPFWTPHITVSLSTPANRCQPVIRNREVHSLGLILLQVGRQKPLDPREHEPKISQRVLDELFGKVGRRYRRVVENCLNKWGNKDIDLMDEEYMKGFWEDICTLESLMSEFVNGF